MILRIDADLDEPLSFVRLQSRRQGRTVHRQQSRNRPHRGPLRLVERHEQRELSIGEAERPQRLVETPSQSAGGALRVKQRQVSRTSSVVSKGTLSNIIFIC